MIEVIHTSHPKARKEYDDDAYEWVREYIDNQCYMFKPKPTFAEYRLLVWVKKNYSDARKIKRGQRYVRQVNKFDGEIVVFRAKIALSEICLRLKMYPEDI